MNPLLRGAGTFLRGASIVGVGALAASTAVMATTKSLVRQQRQQHGTRCTDCKGEGWKECSCCHGSSVITYSPFSVGPVANQRIICPVCNGRAERKCFTCLGEGVVAPHLARSPAPVHSEQNQHHKHSSSKS